MENAASFGMPERLTAAVATYNQSAYLGDALESLLAQSLPPDEIVVVDDGSTDDSESLVRRYFPRVTFVRQENRGLGSARNLALAHSTGDLVSFCDADDIHLRHRFEAHVAMFARFPELAMVSSDLCPFCEGHIQGESVLRTRWLGPLPGSLNDSLGEAFGSWSTAEGLELPVPPRYRASRVYHGYAPQLLALVHVAWGGASTFRREALLAVGKNKENLRRYADWHLSSRIAKRYSFAFLDFPVLLYRLHDGQMSKQSKVGAECSLEVLEEVWRDDPVIYPRYKKTIDRSLGAAYAQLGRICKEEGAYEEAAQFFKKSMQSDPGQKRVYFDLLSASARRVRSLRHTS